MPVNRITKFTFNGDLDFRNKVMSLDTAKHILAHLSAVTGKTIQFSNDMWALIEEDDDAIEILEEAYSRGWNSNEPDIIITAASGYNGVVRINGSDLQLTNVSGTDVWYGSAGTVTAMDDFLKHRNSTYYNSTSTNIKSVRFGKNINTASCTTLFAAFNCTNSDVSLFEKIDVSHLNTSNVTNMQATFGDISIATFGEGVLLVGYEYLNVVNVTNFKYCFGSVYLKNEVLDLHKWHVRSNATIVSIFGGLGLGPITGVNRKVYYTPGYWAKDPMNNSNLAADRVKPTVYPYHDITVAAYSGFNGKIYYDGTLVDMTYDSSLGIWYKDITSQISGNTLRGAFRASNNSTIADNLLSISLKEINAQDYSLDTFGFALGATSLRSADIEGLSGKISTVAYQMFLGDTSLSNLYLPEFGYGYGYSATFMSCINLRYVEFKPNESAGDYFANIFNGCSGLIRISNLPSIANSIDTSAAFTGCTALTTIDSSGQISETIDLSPCPLNIASAKVILYALHTVTSESISFNSSTITAIQADNEAMTLVARAISRGWTVNVPLTFTNDMTISEIRAFLSELGPISSTVAITFTSNTSALIRENYEYEYSREENFQYMIKKARENGWTDNTAYHDIKVTSGSAWNKKIYVDGAFVTCTAESNYYYYDFPTSKTTVNFNFFMTRQSSRAGYNSTLSAVTNVAFGKAFYAIEVTNVGCMFELMSSLTGTQSVQELRVKTGTTVIRMFQQCTGLTRITFPIRQYETWSAVDDLLATFGGCTRLQRIDNLFKVKGGNRTTQCFQNCTALTTLTDPGEQRESLDLSQSPINLASAKLLMAACGTITGTTKTLTFSSTTKGYISGDSEALSIRSAAISRGWSIPL